MFEPELLIAAIPLCPLGGAVINGLVGHRLPRALVALVAVTAVLAAALASSVVFAEVASGGGAALSVTLYEWLGVGALRVPVRLVVDPLSGVMILVITWVGLLIHVFSVGYMSHEHSLARYFAYLNLFSFAMLVLVLGDSLPVMFVGWEGVGVCSYLLIGFWYTDSDKAAAGKKAFIVNRIGDFGFIVAMLILWRAGGTLGFDGLQSAAGQLGTMAATAAALLLLLGATGKSAQIPLYIWLPDAMAGPTPVSALIHAATMVTAGVYLTARMAFLFEMSPVAMTAVAVVGAATALLAATIAVAQNDIKKVLAYSTVSQLGFMFMAAGVGAFGVAIFHVVTHAFFKATLFLGAGSVIHGMGGEQDVRQMGGLWRRQPITAATFIAATLAITGFPFTSGFISKDAILWNAWAAGFGEHSGTFANLGQVLWVVGVLTATLTALYMWRLVLLTFFSGRTRAPAQVAAEVHESPPVMTLPLVVLAAAALVGGALSWPHVLGGHDWLIEQWSGRWSPAPAGAEHAAMEWTRMGVATALAIAGFLVAFFLYGRGVHPWTHRLASERPFRWLYQRVQGKWHADELADVLVVRPVGWISKVVLYELIDRRVVDGLVRRAGWLGRSFGFVGQLLQSGNIQRYIAVFAIALALLLYGWLTPFAAAPHGAAGEGEPSPVELARP